MSTGVTSDPVNSKGRDENEAVQAKLESCEIADPKEQKNKSSNKILMHVRMTRLHQEEPEDTRDERNEVRRLEQRQSRRFTVNRRRTNDQQRQQVHRAFISDSFLRLAFQYEPDIEYYAHSKVVMVLWTRNVRIVML
ncbi:hypothetical protein EVAR_81956_1 [Eumeta japonica]|uniref:Uncharacterized protein n=1 Tax=Eumeta variegata TaxID=151549 RepID=A0A4C1VTM2_EUMVA|nr:hypothetical protein EVAR_81956_1 [Eumeta japonica]